MGALATRCPECGTSFRVQRAQLTASEGLVRCGRCDAVFDARASLVDLETGAPAAWDDASSTPQATASPASPMASAATTTSTTPARDPSFDEDAESSFPSTLATADAQGTERTDPAWDDELPTAPEAMARGVEPALAPSSSEPRGDPALDPEALNQRLRTLLSAGDAAAPSAAFSQTFSSLAPPRAAAQRGWQRGALWLGAAVLTLALPAQWAWTERAALRARSPALDAWLTQACPRCDAPAWARLDGWAVGASSLQPTPQGNAFQLKLSIQNRSPSRLAVPWVDVRLLDAQGRVMLRKALSPHDLGATPDRIEAGGQLALQTVFRVQAPGAAGNAAPTVPSGYEIGLFHP